MCRISLFLIGFVFWVWFSQAQDINKKGLSLKPVSELKDTGKTYALIIGISKYRNPSIPQLQYADRDAEAFKNYLMASGVDSNNIILRTNENARYADIMLDLNDLTDNTKAGDRVFIYFSGHGDVESKVITNDGYLLPYDAPRIVYAISAINVKVLESYVATLSSKGVQAIVITDACHSGNLAGGLEGLKNIQTVLGSKWQDEIKILSCQPGELSLEGKQWGGGRGLFSYTLINGLAGMADKNNDGEVTLRELNLYLMDKVADGANPWPQNPMLSGNMVANISKVNKPLMASLSSHANDNMMLMTVDVRGFDEALLRELDDTIREHYRAFTVMMDTGLYFTRSDPEHTPCAYYHFLRIPENESTKTLIALMQRKMCVVFLKHAEETMDLIMQNKSSSITSRLLKSLMYEMTALRNILGVEKLKKLGFMDKVYFFQAFPMVWHDDKKWAEKGIIVMDSAIAINPNSPFLFMLKGQFQAKIGELSGSIVTNKKAIALSPGVGVTLLALGEAYYSMGQYDSCIMVMDRANEVDPDEWNEVWSYKVGSYYHLDQQDSVAYYIEARHKRAGIDSTKNCDFYAGISEVYSEFKEYPKAISCLKSALGYKPDDINALYGISSAYSLMNDKQNALRYLEQMIKVGYKNFDKMRETNSFDNIRSTPEFKALMKKYFPDQYKE